MINVVVAGAGRIGTLIACLLVESGDYRVHLLDVKLDNPELVELLKMMPTLHADIVDVKNEKKVAAYFKKHDIAFVISSLPYYLNLHVARAAQLAKVHYFDLTEDIHISNEVKKIAKNQPVAFVPQCGLAPGFVNTVANCLIQEFDEPVEARLRVGALPQRASNGLHYSLTWSTDGLINEYGNPCFAIEQGKLVTQPPLQGLETIELDGCIYEAFNTSGGLGSLTEIYKNKIQTLKYKTIRYPGHHDKIKFLMNDLKLNEDRSTLKLILERAIPRTYQDLVVVYIAVQGKLKGEYFEKSYFKKIYPILIRDIEWTAIQISTASSVCAVADLVMKEGSYHGFVMQEQFELNKVLKNQFGKFFV
jgi:saccharopine dehydrogenase-like NADP-dependent oxidoreductase